MNRWFFLLILPVFYECSYGAIRQDICHIINKKGSWPLQHESPIDRAVIKFYRSRKCQPLFHRNGTMNYKGVVAAKLLGESEQDGLSPELYSYSIIYARATKPYMGKKAELDLLLAKGLVSHILDLNRGVEARKNLSEGAYPIVRHLLQESMNSQSLVRYARKHAPAHRFYARLQRGIRSYIKTRDRIIDSNEDFRPILLHDRALDFLVAKRLKLLGDLEESSHQSPSFRAAIKRFQMRHGLKVDGKIGKATLAELNIHPIDRIQTLSVNMERWRKIGGNPGGKDIIVNLAGFELQMFENRRLLTRMKVVIGQKYRQTPVTMAQITDISLNPYWHIPESIVREDILPRILDNKNYLLKHHINVYDGWESSSPLVHLSRKNWLALSDHRLPFKYRLTQSPGPKNPLGQVKFEMPGTDGIYLHDTWNKSQFDMNRRILSRGCIRLEEPIRLAALILSRDGGDWSRQKILRSIRTGKTKRFHLKKPITVYLTYQTAWAAENGIVHFVGDIYGRDDHLKKMIFSSHRNSGRLGH